MKATASEVACSAGMMRSPSFSRSSSSMMMTIRPARSSASSSPTELRAGPAADLGGDFPGSGSTLDMARAGAVTALQYTRWRRGALCARSVPRGWRSLGQERQHGFAQRLLGDGLARKQARAHGALRVDHVRDRHREWRRVAQLLHHGDDLAAVGCVIDADSEQHQALLVIALIEGVERGHLGAA